MASAAQDLCLLVDDHAAGKGAARKDCLLEPLDGRDEPVGIESIERLRLSGSRPRGRMSASNRLL